MYKIYKIHGYILVILHIVIHGYMNYNKDQLKKTKAGTAKLPQAQTEPALIKKKGSYIVAQVKNYDK